MAPWAQEREGSPGARESPGVLLMEEGSSRPGGLEGAGRAANSQRESQSSSRKTGSGGCLPKAPTIPIVHVCSEKVRGTIELWKEKALIGKFMGIWPKEKDLIRWMSRV